MRREAQESKALRTLATGVVEVESQGDLARRRERLVPNLALAIERASRREARRRRIHRVAMVLALAAAVVLIVGMGWSAWRSGSAPRESEVAAMRVESTDGSVIVTHDGGEAPAMSGVLSKDDAITTAEGARAVVRLASGTSLRIGPSTQVSLGGTTGSRDEVTLSAGYIEATVPKLGAEASFEVVTPDARVRVHGTQFSVRVQNSEGGIRTEVHVTEGVVSVLHGGGVAMLHASASWSSEDRLTERRDTEDGDSPEMTGEGVRSIAEGGAPLGDGGEKVRPVTSDESRAEPSAIASTHSSLAEENAALQRAMQAARAGQDERSLALLNEFLARYPRSPLAQNARVERFRTLARLGRNDAASRDARRYMAEHPGGFASDEARDLVMPPASGGTGGR
jgi:ferric-dicitrate binding protein FerR (iron transport regulator)